MAREGLPEGWRQEHPRRPRGACESPVGCLRVSEGCLRGVCGSLWGVHRASAGLCRVSAGCLRISGVSAGCLRGVGRASGAAPAAAKASARLSSTRRYRRGEYQFPASPPLETCPTPPVPPEGKGGRASCCWKRRGTRVVERDRFQWPRPAARAPHLPPRSSRGSIATHLRQASYGLSLVGQCPQIHVLSRTSHCGRHSELG